MPEDLEALLRAIPPSWGFVDTVHIARELGCTPRGAPRALREALDMAPASGAGVQAHMLPDGRLVCRALPPKGDTLVWCLAPVGRRPGMPGEGPFARWRVDDAAAFTPAPQQQPLPVAPVTYEPAPLTPVLGSVIDWSDAELVRVRDLVSAELAVRTQALQGRLALLLPGLLPDALGHGPCDDGEEEVADVLGNLDISDRLRKLALNRDRFGRGKYGKAIRVGWRKARAGLREEIGDTVNYAVAMRLHTTAPARFAALVAALDALLDDVA
jgi:hypothetical protein